MKYNESGFESKFLEKDSEHGTYYLIFLDVTVGSEWFPRHIGDLDVCAKRVIMYGSGLSGDHPGFTDETYRKRRLLFAEMANNYKQKTIYLKLRELHQKHACKEFLENFKFLERFCNYSENNIPQLEEISRFLKAKSGFTLRPVAGYLSARDFLACLAFRVFCCTQYIRHHSDPFYTPEPDTVHELIGHVPLLADPLFAQFTQDIGLASLGASEDDLKKLATIYFFTIEFGLCRSHSSEQLYENDRIRKNGELKVYGAGLLSSANELQHAISNDANVEEFQLEKVIKQSCLVTTYQENYFYTRTFEEVIQKLRSFTMNMNRPFIARYNPYTETIEVLNNKRTLMMAVSSIRSDINLLSNALNNVL
ncbi:unnamed protein product [Dracunculus medinensis]|uniref:BH4_AAA_HYDROXYL_2 domain-containing protein n=1 Tax=Dracunculus medinensis TaxID=318479 RepID=A0A0N4URV5_DRAME|nr:unnamed protein product [Dracunculus medinensis]